MALFAEAYQQLASRRPGLVSTTMGALGMIALVWMMAVFADVR